MSHLRRLNYSASLAASVTALSIFFEAHGGSLLLAPGVIFEFILITLVVHGDGEAFSYTDSGWVGSVVLYTLGIYIPLWFYSIIREYQLYLSE